MMPNESSLFYQQPSSQGRMDAIHAKLEEGLSSLQSSDAYRNYLDVMSRFYHYSYKNCLLISGQMPDATLVASYHAWNQKFGRHVKKGEHGIKILAPVVINSRVEKQRLDAKGNPVLNPDGTPVKDWVEVQKSTFKIATVFDVSQTDGAPLPTVYISELKGEVLHYKEFLDALLTCSPVPVRFEKLEGGEKGYYDPIQKVICLQEEMSKPQTIKTLIHEIAHAKLHSDPDSAFDRHEKEIQAESVAYCVCQRFGIDSSDYSFGYITSWQKEHTPEELKAALAVVQETEKDIIATLEAQMQPYLMIQKEGLAVEVDGKGYLLFRQGDPGLEYAVYDSRYALLNDGVFPAGEGFCQDPMAILPEVLRELGWDTEAYHYIDAGQLQESVWKNNENERPSVVAQLMPVLHNTSPCKNEFRRMPSETRDR